MVLPDFTTSSFVFESYGFSILTIFESDPNVSRNAWLMIYKRNEESLVTGTCSLSSS
jgi:hypothetical protein